MNNLKRSLISCIVLLLITFSCYWLTLAPGVTWANWGADGGDYLAALQTGGIPHPTGYPTYMLLAKAYQLIPVATLALRGNVFSALATSMAGIMLFLMLRERLESSWKGHISAFVGALLFALSPLVWSQAVITEVYGLHSLFFSSVLYVFFSREIKRWLWGVMGLLLGLGIGNHVTTAMLVPAVLLIKPNLNEKGFPSLRELFLDRADLAPKLIGLMSGLSIYATIFLYARNPSPVRWLKPTNLSRFWELVSGQMYHFYWDFPVGASLIEELSKAFATVVQQVGWVNIFIVTCGLIVAVRRQKVLLFLMGWIFFVSLIFTIGYQTEDAVVYLIPAVFCIGVLFAVGLNWLLISKTQSLIQRLVLLGVATGLVMQFSSAYAFADASRDFRAINYGLEVMNAAPLSAIIFTQEDKDTFTLWYYQHVENLRPDLFILVTPFLRYDWYLEIIAETYPTLRIPSQTLVIRETLEEANDYPSCSTYPLSITVLDCK